MTESAAVISTAFSILLVVNVYYALWRVVHRPSFPLRKTTKLDRWIQRFNAWSLEFADAKMIVAAALFIAAVMFLFEVVTP